MVINWDYVKKRTLWSYEDLMKKLYQTLGYQFVQEHYNHSMDEAIDYLDQIHAGYMQQRQDCAWLLGLRTNFSWLKRVRIQNYLDLVQQVDSREKCEAFLKASGFGFAELIETLNYLLRWVLPFPTPLRDFFDTNDAMQMAYFQALKQQHINTSLDLLEQGRTPVQRLRLAEKSAIPFDFLLRLVHQADLSRLAYVRGKTVRHLCGGGYDTLAKLASADCEAMEAAMNAYYYSLGKRPQDFKAVVQLGPLIGGAKRLPRVVEE